MQVDRSLLLVAPIVFLAACSGFAQSAGSYSTFGKGCSGQTRDPLLFAMNLPFTGRVFTSVVSHIRPSSFGLLIIGNSDKQGAGYNLPLNLRFLGAANCNLLVSYDFTLSFVTGTGSAVIAARAGKVIFSDQLPGYGWMIILEHDRGFSTLYAHNRRNRVAVSDQVSRGQRIADLGSSGRTAKPHLHFEIRRRNVVRDPMYYLSESGQQRLAGHSN